MIFIASGAGRLLHIVLRRATLHRPGLLANHGRRALQIARTNFHVDTFWPSLHLLSAFLIT